MGTHGIDSNSTTRTPRPWGVRFRRFGVAHGGPVIITAWFATSAEAVKFFGNARRATAYWGVSRRIRKRPQGGWFYLWVSPPEHCPEPLREMRYHRVSPPPC